MRAVFMTYGRDIFTWIFPSLDLPPTVDQAAVSRRLGSYTLAVTYYIGYTHSLDPSWLTEEIGLKCDYLNSYHSQKYIYIYSRHMANQYFSTRYWSPALTRVTYGSALVCLSLRPSVPPFSRNGVIGLSFWSIA